MLRRIVWLLLAFPAALLLVTLAVSNRHNVRLVLNPFRTDNPDIYIELPFYAFLLGVLVIGVVLGGLSTWISQSGWRRTARSRTQEAMRWHAEADRLARERDSQISASKRLLSVAR